jgi:hypothetical protein
MEADRAEQEKASGATIGVNSGQSTAETGSGASGVAPSPTSVGAEIETPPPLRRFHGSVKLDPVRLGRDASVITSEVVQHLAGIVGADVEITLEIQATLPDAASEKLIRDVTENCRTLQFGNYGFEEA